MTNIYDNFSETFSKSRKNMNWPEIEYMIDFIKNSESIKTIKKISILDVGCGNGRLLKFLNNSGLNFDYTGIDSSSGMINEAKKEFPNNKFIVLDMIKLDKLKEKFDIVFFIASFHHIFSEQDREKILKISKQD
ncbi:class I SAM-dependent methyltransferase, partial [Candidatus Gracilibacteria bacterium]|nr:class I SAM-dependent methyltransferase [Candidatus Gracilibacteria bacterium]